MYLNEWIQKNKIVVAIAAVVAIVLSSAFIFSSVSSGGRGIVYGKVWYTSDDGKTFFAGDKSLIPPASQSGKILNGCEVVSDDGGKTQTVAYLYRYRPEVHDRVRDLIVNGVKMSDPRFETTSTVRAWQDIDDEGKEVKRPNDADAKWVPASSAKGQAVVQVASGKQSVFP